MAHATSATGTASRASAITPVETVDADAPGVGEEHGHGRTRAGRSRRPPDRSAPEGGCTTGTRARAPVRDAAMRRAGPWVTTANPTAAAAADAGGQHVEAVEQVEAVDQDDTG